MKLSMVLRTGRSFVNRNPGSPDETNKQQWILEVVISEVELESATAELPSALMRQWNHLGYPTQSYSALQRANHLVCTIHSIHLRQDAFSKLQITLFYDTHCSKEYGE